jgi:hypothetical protein
MAWLLHTHQVESVAPVGPSGFQPCEYSIPFRLVRPMTFLLVGACAADQLTLRPWS